MPVDYLSALNNGGSGLNISQIVDSLVEAETLPQKETIQKKIDKQNASISALAEVVSELDSLKTLATSFQDKTKLNTSSSSSAASISVTSASVAQAFNSDLNISTLATAQTLEFSGFSLPTSSTGSGTIAIDFGQWITSSTTDDDSLFSGVSVSASTSLGTPTSHSSLGGKITIKTIAGGDQSSTSFTVVGMDMAGNSITETISGASSGNTTTGTKVFKTVTSITPGSTVGSGNVTIGHVAATFGSNSSKASTTISISSGSTLNTVASSLSAVTGITANIINKGNGTYSLLVRTEEGLNNAIKLTVSETSGDTGLATFDNSSSNTQQTTAATDATFTVDGATITRETNSITDLFDGFTIDLSSTTSSAFRISSSLDKTSALDTLKEFVDVINNTREKLNELTQIAEGSEDAGPLYNNIAVKSIKDNISSILTSGIEGFEKNKLYIAELGVRTNLDGTLFVNEDTFNSQFDADSTVFDAIFNSMFSSDSSYLSIEPSIGSSNPTPGSYVFSSSSTETTLASTASLSTVQTIEVSSSSDIDIGDYVTGIGIPSETTVTAISGTTITISNQIPSGTEIDTGTAISFVSATLDGAQMTSQTGTDNIPYFVSSGSAADTGGIKITPTQTVNDAFVFYGKSVVQKLSEFIESALASSGIVNKAKTDANSQLTEFNENLSSVDEKVDTLTKRYRRQFTAMEQVVTSLKSTGSYLENMMDSWNKE